jgi:hypothetical protein
MSAGEGAGAGEADEAATCPICFAKPMVKTCAKCKLRRYCSKECQRADWKVHKRYCTPPYTDEEQIGHMKHMLNSPMNSEMVTWQDVEDLARRKALAAMPTKKILAREKVGSQAPTSDIKNLQSCVDELLGLENGADTNSHTLHKAHIDTHWPGQFLASSVQQLQQTGAAFCVTFQSEGHMHERSGYRMWTVMVMETGTQMVRSVDGVEREPTPNAQDCGRALFAAMFSPAESSGAAMRPSEVLIANRWGQSVYEALRPELAAAGIMVRFEPRLEAEASARRNRTNPDGLNYN